MTVKVGESRRNTVRTLGRNSAALDLALARSGAPSSTALYQYCSNQACKRVEVLLISVAKPRVDDAEVTVPAHIKSLARSLRVNVVTFVHRVKDEFLRAPVLISVWEWSTDTSHREMTTWQQGAKLLRNFQTEHERTSQNPKCAPPHYDAAWLTAPRVRGQGRLDLSLSNMIRCIPGVRHIDIDAFTYCDSCAQPQVVIEASSDGMKGSSLESKKKATLMSRRVASVVQTETLLVQHHVNDDAHERGVLVTCWDVEGRQTLSRETSWSNLEEMLRQYHERHSQECPSLLA